MSYAQLTREERCAIAHLKMAKFSLREIARRLGRHHSTISREIKRNGPALSHWVYWYDVGHPGTEWELKTEWGQALPFAYQPGNCGRKLGSP